MSYKHWYWGKNKPKNNYCEYVSTILGDSRNNIEKKQGKKMVDYIKDNVSVLCNELGNLSDFFVQIHNITVDNDTLPTQVHKIKAVMKLKVVNEKNKKERFLNKHLAKYILDSYKMINFKKKSKMMNKQIEERKVISKIHRDSKQFKKVYVDTLSGGGKVEVPNILLGGDGKAALANYEKVRLYNILKDRQLDNVKLKQILTNKNVTLTDLSLLVLNEGVDLTKLDDSKKLFTKTYFENVVEDFKKQNKIDTEIDVNTLPQKLSDTYSSQTGFNKNLNELNKILRTSKGGKDLTSMEINFDELDKPSIAPPNNNDAGADTLAEDDDLDDDPEEDEPEVRGGVRVIPPTVFQAVPSGMGPGFSPTQQPTLIPPKLPPIKPLTASRPSSSSPGMLGTCGQCNNCLACLPYMLNYTLFSEFYRPLKIMDILLMAFSVFPFIGWYFDIVMIFKALVERRYIYAIYSSINLYQWFFWRLFGLHID